MSYLRGSREVLNGDKESTTQTNTHKWYKTRKLHLKNALAKNIFSALKQANVFRSVASILKLTTDEVGGF